MTVEQCRRLENYQDNHELRDEASSFFIIAHSFLFLLNLAILTTIQYCIGKEERLIFECSFSFHCLKDLLITAIQEALEEVQNQLWTRHG